MSHGPQVWLVLLVGLVAANLPFLSQRVLVMSARPGRVIDELAIDAPYPRTAAFRHSALFADACARLAAALETAHA